MKDVVDAAVAKAYGGEKEISWMEIFCGEKSGSLCDDQWLPEETLQACKDYSFNQRAINNSCWGWNKIPKCGNQTKADLYVCLRPVKYFAGTPSPVKRPDLVDMVIFRRILKTFTPVLNLSQTPMQPRNLSMFLKKILALKD